MGAPLRKKSKSSVLTTRVGFLSAELGQMKELLLALEPRADAPEPPWFSEEAEEDSLSIAASTTHFGDFMGESST